MGSRDTHALDYLTSISYFTDQFLFIPYPLYAICELPSVNTLNVVLDYSHIVLGCCIIEMKHLTYTYFRTRMLLRISFVLSVYVVALQKASGLDLSLRDFGGSADTKSERKSCTMSAAAMLVMSA